jgi:hypothetical protein
VIKIQTANHSMPCVNNLIHYSFSLRVFCFGTRLVSACSARAKETEWSRAKCPCVTDSTVLNIFNISLFHIIQHTISTHSLQWFSTFSTHFNTPIQHHCKWSYKPIFQCIRSFFFWFTRLWSSLWVQRSKVWKGEN